MKTKRTKTRHLKSKNALILVVLVTIAAIITMSLSNFSARVYAKEKISITEFSLPDINSGPYDITSGSDGNLWFIESIGKIGRITPNGAITEFPLLTNERNLAEIIAGPDGNLWFTKQYAVGRVSPNGIITEFPVPKLGWPSPTDDSGPTGITSGPDGNIWFTEVNIDRIGRITPSGTITEFPLHEPNPDINNPLSPTGITTGPDGNLWFTGPGGNKIGKITPDGVITEYPLTVNDLQYPPGPRKITSGPDGNLWFTEYKAIGRITPTGIISRFPVPTGSYPEDITTGPDGNLWFTETLYSPEPIDQPYRIGRITPNGEITEFPPGSSSLFGITSGPDGNIWFTDTGAGKIGRVNLSNLPPVEGERQVMFVHGINGNVKDIQMCNGGEDFQTLLCDPSIHPNMRYFTYYQDLGYKIKGDGCEPQPTPDTNTESLYPHPESISPYICDSQSAIAYNATKLDHDLLELSSPTAIIAHSMGATITRGWLTLAQSKQDDPTLNIVDTVMTIQGAHQGSYIPLGALPILKSFSWASALLAAVITRAEELIGFYKDRPAEADLTPKSKWYESANLTNVPAKMNYFNFYSDIQVSARPQIFFVTLPRLGSVSFGDIVLLPGDPNPKKLPVFGGARFLPPSGSPANRHEFLLAKNYDVLLGSDILDFSFAGQLLGIAQNIVMDPRTHLNLFNHLTDAAIPIDSCKSPNIQTTIQNEILRILEDPKDACDRQGGLR